MNKYRFDSNTTYTHDANMINNNLNVCSIPSLKTLNDLRQIASNYNFCKHLVIIGMGGAILNPSAVLSALLPYVCNVSEESANDNMQLPAVYFTHYIDGYYIKQIGERIDLSSTVFLVISNSGYTIETLEITRYFLNQTRSTSKFIFVLGHDRSSPIRRLASTYKCNYSPIY